jgi:hypothetical protein
MSLAEHQRAVRDLLCDRAVERHDAYVEEVSGSEAVALVQDIASSWRRFALERTCPLTAAALRQRGALDDALATHGRHGPHSPFLEVLAQQFLALAAHHEDELVAAIARFELSAHRARTGAASADEDVVIDWPCDPWDALQAVLDAQPPPPASGPWRTCARATTPDQFRIDRLAPTSTR